MASTRDAPTRSASARKASIRRRPTPALRLAGGTNRHQGDLVGVPERPQLTDESAVRKFRCPLPCRLGTRRTIAVRRFGAEPSPVPPIAAEVVGRARQPQRPVRLGDRVGLGPPGAAPVLRTAHVAHVQMGGIVPVALIATVSCGSARQPSRLRRSRPRRRPAVRPCGSWVLPSRLDPRDQTAHPGRWLARPIGARRTRRSNPEIEWLLSATSFPRSVVDDRPTSRGCDARAQGHLRFVESVELTSWTTSPAAPDRRRATSARGQPQPPLDLSVADDVSADRPRPARAATPHTDVAADLSSGQRRPARPAALTTSACADHLGSRITPTAADLSGPQHRRHGTRTADRPRPARTAIAARPTSPPTSAQGSTRPPLDLTAQTTSAPGGPTAPARTAVRRTPDVAADLSSRINPDHRST